MDRGGRLQDVLDVVALKDDLVLLSLDSETVTSFISSRRESVASLRIKRLLAAIGSLVLQLIHYSVMMQ